MQTALKSGSFVGASARHGHGVQVQALALRAPASARQIRTRANSTAQSPEWQESFILDNPLIKSAIELLDVQGKSVPVSQLVEGKTVVGLLRHLGCPMCWEQASNLLKLKPQFEAHGFKLMFVAIGYPEGGKKMCESLAFPEELLFLDPERKIYTELHLNTGLKYFFTQDTKDGIKGLDQDIMKDVLKRYKFIKPPNAECTLQMGGLYVLDGPKLLYAHMDKGLAHHASNPEVLAACCSGPALALA